MRNSTKNYLLYFIAALLAIALFSSLNRWYQIKLEKDANVYSERKLAAIHSVLQSQKYLLQDDNSYFEDAILQNNQQLKKQLEKLQTTLHKRYRTIINQLQLDFLEHQQDIEDYISTQAVFHNSLFYLMQYSVTSDSQLSKQVKESLYQYYHKRVLAQVEKNRFEKKRQKSIEAFLVKRHLYIFVTKYNSITKIKEKLNHDKLLIHLEELQYQLYERYDVLQTKEKTTLLYIASSAMLLLLLLIFLFVQLGRTINALTISNADIKRFYQTFQEFTIFSRGDLNGHIIDVNQKFCELSGYTKEELISKNFSIVRSGKMGEAFYQNLWSTLHKQKPFHAIVTNKNKNNEEYYVDVIIVPILNNDGTTKEYISIQHDITELIQARDAAKASLRAKDSFMSNMSHELRTPLNSIIGFSTVLEKKLQDDKLKGYAQRVVESSNSLLELINNILDLSKINSGHFKLDSYKFNLNNELQNLLANFSMQLTEKKLHLNINFDYENGVILKADFKRISQILNNLFSNALKFSPEESNIYFNVSLYDETLHFELKDEGIGMSEEAQKRIFNAFEQADNSTTRKYGGTGLGLNITKSLVELMHGKIELHSVEGEGTSFKIDIPVELMEYEETTPQKESEEESYEPLNAHALIVEDNKTNQMLIKLLLEDMGLSYAVANDGVEAVHLYAQEKFDIVLMDENMPTMNGTEAMKVIRHRHQDVCPIIALTANAMSEDREKFLKAGFDNYLSKPIDDEELYKMLKSELHK